MAEGGSWEEVNASYQASVEHMRDQAARIYEQMVDHVTREIEGTGADIEIVTPGTPLPKRAGTSPISLHMDVTPTTANFARQLHVAERPGQKHRSWPIRLETATLPVAVRNGLSRFVEQIAELQGRRIDRPQSTLDL